MSAFVDTNVLIRHLTNDPPEQARRSRAILERERELILTDVIFAEAIYVLESAYQRPRSEVAALMRSVLAFRSIRVFDAPLLIRAVELYEVEGLDFAEAYLASAAEHTGVLRVASFDRALDRLGTVERIG